MDASPIHPALTDLASRGGLRLTKYVSVSQVKSISETTEDPTSLVVALVRSNDVGSKVPLELLEPSKSNVTAEPVADDSQDLDPSGSPLVLKPVSGMFSVVFG